MRLTFLGVFMSLATWCSAEENTLPEPSPFGAWKLDSIWVMEQGSSVAFYGDGYKLAGAFGPPFDYNENSDPAVVQHAEECFSRGPLLLVVTQKAILIDGQPFEVLESSVDSGASYFRFSQTEDTLDTHLFLVAHQGGIRIPNGQRCVMLYKEW